VLGLFLARDGACGLEAVQARHHHVHEDQVRLLALGALDGDLAAVDQQHVVAALLQQSFHEGAFGR
jgi:hypothetical protein